jgi:hypothetical protein
MAKVITAWCATSSRPFSIVQDEGIMQVNLTLGLLEVLETYAKYAKKDNSLKPSDVIPNPTTVSRNMNYLATEIRGEVIEILAIMIFKREGVNFTTDMYT